MALKSVFVIKIAASGPNVSPHSVKLTVTFVVRTSSGVINFHTCLSVPWSMSFLRCLRSRIPRLRLRFFPIPL
ncbi:hypothetical protein BBBOND_0201080 [Babesia bigemina]|uniref:Uncharacterized protein n=1 Tax=Babesia bigemina TaxID=5866 RepID=A0A061D2F7_BABBI|nr:hypothetical protein BBBOND_0201080 [Babesia bigemina]CDR94951.1 hypothetical protein BBBOND_0201080 [Babesia bigemina]|eukprot:XP_012767137.1 hypothetical protein BBBOND_0201080 [Babesia bigemina]